MNPPRVPYTVAAERLGLTVHSMLVVALEKRLRTERVSRILTFDARDVDELLDEPRRPRQRYNKSRTARKSRAAA